jgi:hypothetical protein
MSSLDIKPLDNQRSTEIVTTPRLPFSAYINAAKGSGKSTLILNMLLNPQLLYRKFNEIYFISPTAKLDRKIHDNLDDKNITIPNTKLMNLIKKLKQKQILDNGLADRELPTLNEQRNNIHYIETLSVPIIEEIIASNKAVTENFSKDYANKILLIIDDSVESKIFKQESMKKLMYKSRHFNVSIIITSQSYFELAKPLRLNMSYVMLYETGSKKELDTIYQEHNAGLKFQQFYKMYSDIMEVPYSFLLINYQNSKKHRFQNGFKEFIDLEQYKEVK